jgi:hypothetical protein
MRRLLETNFLETQIGEEREKAPVADKRLDIYVDSLLCSECNQGWAIDLEETVGRVGFA